MKNVREKKKIFLKKYGKQNLYCCIFNDKRCLKGLLHPFQKINLIMIAQFRNVRKLGQNQLISFKPLEITLERNCQHLFILYNLQNQ